MKNILPITLAILLLAGCSTTSAPEEPTPAALSEESPTTSEEVEEDSDSEEAHEDHSSHQERRFDDPEYYARHWNDPARDEWQKPEEIVAAMGIEEGMTVADIGAGTGYFIPHLSRAVGASGRVIAVDVEPAMLTYIEEMAEDEGLQNVQIILVQGSDSGLPNAEVDRVLTVNTWHHIPERTTYSEHLLQRLTPQGSVWVVDYREDSDIGPPAEHRLAPQVVQDELEAGGFSTEIYDLALQRQFIVIGRRP